MRIIYLVALVLVFSSTLAYAGGDEWLTDYQAALKQAKTEKKAILADFTGSDWCGWCVKLNREIFSQKAFRIYAAKNLVLLTLDFPSRKKIPAAVKAQNVKLAKKFGIKGFPTIILLNFKEQEIARTGYRRGGAKKYVEHLESLLAKK